MSEIKYYKLEADDILSIIIKHLYSENKGYDLARGMLLSDNDEIRFVGAVAKDGDKEFFNMDLKELDKNMEYNGEHAFLKENEQFLIKDGFSFCAITKPFTNNDAIEIIDCKYNEKKYIDYINANAIEKAHIVMPDISFIKKCPSLKYLYVEPSYNATDAFNFFPLYDMNEIKFLNCENIYGEKYELLSELDCSRLKGIEYLSVSFNQGIVNLENIPTLKSLSIRGFVNKNKDLTGLFNSKVLDTLELNECKEKTLKGIEVSEKLQCLYLNYNRSLEDISSLAKFKDTLKALCIDKCPKIKDFSVLNELENLEYLELSGSNKLPNLKFLKKMKNLKTFFFDYNVLDGDLSYCLNVPNVWCDRVRKHYNLKDTDLPKGEFFAGNENIEEWRRIE